MYWNITVIKGLSNYKDEYTRKCQILDQLISSTISFFPSREIPINKFDLSDNSSRIVQSKIPNYRAFIRSKETTSQKEQTYDHSIFSVGREFLVEVAFIDR